VVGLEHGGEHLRRIDPQAGEQFGVGARNPGRRAAQAVTVGILTDGEQDLPDGGLDARQVDGLLDADTTQPPVDKTGGQVVERIVVVDRVVGVWLGAAPRRRPRNSGQFAPSPVERSAGPAPARA
jgi:hypothetical protein